jgi:hypothetical protein
VAWLEPHEIFVHIFFTWLKQKLQKSDYFSIQNFSNILTKIIPTSSLWMFYLYFPPKFTYFSLKFFQKLSSKIFMHFCQLKVCLHFQHSSQIRSFKKSVYISCYIQLGFDRKINFSNLAMWWRYVKLGGYMAWLVFFLN